MAERIDMWKSTDDKIHSTEYDANLRNIYLEIHAEMSEDFYRDACSSTTEFLEFILEHRSLVDRLLNMGQEAK
jgi:hypothetical protein